MGALYFCTGPNECKRRTSPPTGTRPDDGQNTLNGLDLVIEGRLTAYEPAEVGMCRRPNRSMDRISLHRIGTWFGLGDRHPKSRGSGLPSSTPDRFCWIRQGRNIQPNTLEFRAPSFSPPVHRGRPNSVGRWRSSPQGCSPPNGRPSPRSPGRLIICVENAST